MEKTKKIKLLIAVFTILPALIVLYYFLQNIVDAFTFKEFDDERNKKERLDILIQEFFAVVFPEIK